MKIMLLINWKGSEVIKIVSGVYKFKPM